MTDMTPGSRWLLPVTFDLKVKGYSWLTFFGGRSICADPDEMEALIPASTLTQLEADVAKWRWAYEATAESLRQALDVERGDQ